MTRHIAFRRLHNFRDVGGYPAAGGRTLRWGRLYRSDALSVLADPAAAEDLRRFRELGIRTVIDLRYPWEISARGRVPAGDGLGYHNLSVEHRPVRQAELPHDTEPVRFFAELHAEAAHDGTEELRRILELAADQANTPLVFHCAAGKDRTGLVAAVLLALLGVGEEDIVADYALSGLATERLLADRRARKPGERGLWPGYGLAPADSMRLFLDRLTADHGSVRGYARDRLGADDALVARLRSHLLEG